MSRGAHGPRPLLVVALVSTALAVVLVSRPGRAGVVPDGGADPPGAVPAVPVVQAEGGEPAGFGSYHGSWPPDDAPGRSWALPRDNPPLTPACGLDVALLVDRSGSIARAGQAAVMRGAAEAVVDALAGTPSRVGVWSFGASSAAEPGDPEHPAWPLSAVGGVDGPRNVADLRGAIESIPIGHDAPTNWEAGLDAVRRAGLAAGSPPDLLLVLTDGRPTVHDADRSSGASTDVEDVGAGIRSANRLKHDGTRVLAVGIGPQVDPTTLALISGPIEWTGGALADAGFVRTDFGHLTTTLRTFVTELCGGTISVTKVIEHADGSRAPGPGWTFTLASSHDPTWSQAAVTDERGTAVFELANTDGLVVTVTEAAQPGAHLVASRISCTGATWTPDPRHTSSGVELAVGPEDVVTCVFPNRADPPEPPPPPSPPPGAPVDPTPEPGVPRAQRSPAETTVPASASDAPSVATVRAAPTGPLPRTGSATTPLVLAGSVLVAGGVGLLALSRSRSCETPGRAEQQRPRTDHRR